MLGGIGTLIAIPFVANVNPNVIGNNELQFNGQQSLTPSEQTALAKGSGSILTVLGAVLIPLGIASLVVAYGLFKAKSWAWSVAVVLWIIGVVVNVISLITANMGAITGALIGIAINAIVLYYLSRRIVRQYFGKVSTPRESTTARIRNIKATWFRSFFPEPSNCGSVSDEYINQHRLNFHHHTAMP